MQIPTKSPHASKMGDNLVWCDNVIPHMTIIHPLLPAGTPCAHCVLLKCVETVDLDIFPVLHVTIMHPVTATIVCSHCLAVALQADTEIYD